MIHSITQTNLSSELKSKISQGFSAHATQAMGFDGKYNEICFVALNDVGNFMGVVAVQLFWGQLHLKYMFVELEFRGNNIGRSLCERAFKYGQDNKCDFVFVETMSFQAHKFYEKLEFSTDFKRKGFSKNIDFIYMSKKL